jgi:hypothetical protein
VPTTSPSVSHIRITQAGLIALLTTIVGQVVAFVPAFGPDKQDLISAGSAVIAAAFLLANGVHALASSNVNAKDVEAGAIAAARSEISKVNFDALISDAVNAKSPADLEAMVRAEAQKAVAGLLGKLAGDPAPAPLAASIVVPGDVGPVVIPGTPTV